MKRTHVYQHCILSGMSLFLLAFTQLSFLASLIHSNHNRAKAHRIPFHDILQKQEEKEDSGDSATNSPADAARRFSLLNLLSPRVESPKQRGLGEQIAEIKPPKEPEQQQQQQQQQLAREKENGEKDKGGKEKEKPKEKSNGGGGKEMEKEREKSKEEEQDIKKKKESEKAQQAATPTTTAKKPPQPQPQQPQQPPQPPQQATKDTNKDRRLTQGAPSSPRKEEASRKRTMTDPQTRPAVIEGMEDSRDAAGNNNSTTTQTGKVSKGRVVNSEEEEPLLRPQQGEDNSDCCCLCWS